MKLLIYLLVILLLKICQAQDGDYVLELNCTSITECVEILSIISGNFYNFFGNTINASLEGNFTGIHPIPELLYEDYDECDDTLNYCVENANCVNVFRTYRCECIFGFQGLPGPTDAFNCTDINECSNSTLNNCSGNQQCVNTPGSYECHCPNPNGNGLQECPSRSSTKTFGVTSTSIPTETTLLSNGTSVPFLSKKHTNEESFAMIEASSMATRPNLDSSHDTTKSNERLQTGIPLLPTEAVFSQSTNFNAIFKSTTPFPFTILSTPFAEFSTLSNVSPKTTITSTSSTQTKIASDISPPTTITSSVFPLTKITSTVSPQTTITSTVSPQTTITSTVSPQTTISSTVSPQTAITPTVSLLANITSTASLTPTNRSGVSSQTTITSFTSHQITITSTVNSQTNPTTAIPSQTNITSVVAPQKTVSSHATIASSNVPPQISSSPIITVTTTEAPFTSIYSIPRISSQPITLLNTIFLNTFSDSFTSTNTSTNATSTYAPTSKDESTTTNVTDSSTSFIGIAKTTSLIPVVDTNNSTAVQVTSATPTINIPTINSEDLISGAEDPEEIIRDLSAILSGPPVSEDLAVVFVQAFDAFASASAFVPSESLVEVTQIAERLLNTMNLQNGSFVFRSGSIAVAAIDVVGSRLEPLQYARSSGFNASAASPPSITLPTSLFAGRQQRVSFTAYDDARLFPVDGIATITNETFNFAQFSEESVVNSIVIGSALNGTEVENLLDPIDIQINTKITSVPDEIRENSTTVRRALFNARCVFFNYTLRNGSGDWSEDGCVTMETSAGSLACQCNHLTSFAVLMSVETRIDDHVLTILTYVGCSLSIFGLLASILTYSLFRHLRIHKSKQILLHFSIALCGVYIVYIFGITAALPNSQAECTLSGFFLHFFTSATFAWMFIEVLDMYLLFVKVWSEISNPVKKACLFGWGFPLLLSIATLGAHFGLQNRFPGQDVPQLYPEYRPTTICWLTTTGLYWAFFLPMGVILTINLILFVIVLYHVTCKRANNKLTRNHSNTRKIKAKQHILNALAILLLSGPTWIIGFFINIDPISDGVLRRILAYIFVITNAFQGLWIFVVFTVRPQAVRTAWKNLFTGRGLRQTVRSGSSSWGRRMTKTSSTYLSRANRRKSSTDIRRSSASSSVSAFKISASSKLRKMEVNHGLNEKSSIGTKKYRYTVSPKLSLDSESNSTSGRNSNTGSDQNFVTEDVLGKVNPTFDGDEPGATSS